MALSLQKNTKLSLTKTNGGVLNKVLVQLRWTSPNDNYDADASCLLLDANNVCLNWKNSNNEKLPHFCFYGQQETPFMESSGDDRSGEDGEDLIINLKDLPSECSQVPVLITLYDAVKRRQSLADLQTGTITLIDYESGDVLATGEMSKCGSNDISLLFVVMERSESGWCVNCVNQGYNKDIGDWVKAFSVDLG